MVTLKRPSVDQSSDTSAIGIVAGNSDFPLSVAKDAKKLGFRVHAVCYLGETSEEISDLADSVEWIKLGEFGRLIKSFKQHDIENVIFAGGIKRVDLFGGVKLDLRGAQLLAKVRSTKDDLLLRGIAAELEKEGIIVDSCTKFCQSSLAELGLLAGPKLSSEQLDDIKLGREVLQSLGEFHVGQLCVIKEGVVVAIEAVEGSDKAIIRGGELGGPGTVVVKCSKPTQDMRFDVPTVGLKTLESLKTVKSSVLAIESGNTIVLEKESFLRRSSELKIAIWGF